MWSAGVSELLVLDEIQPELIRSDGSGTYRSKDEPLVEVRWWGMAPPYTQVYQVGWGHAPPISLITTPYIRAQLSSDVHSGQVAALFLICSCFYSVYATKR
ncbi:MAG: hypothetical protein ABW157_06225 [Candidatus Thiodiazotropha sp. LLP2]